jgi:hypothetical protein
VTAVIFEAEVPRAQYSFWKKNLLEYIPLGFEKQTPSSDQEDYPK